MARPPVGIIGASSLVGESLIANLGSAGEQVMAFSRKSGHQDTAFVAWRTLSGKPAMGANVIEDWVCVAPIWILPDCFPLLEAHGAKRIVALSSTSRFTKSASSDPEEQEVALRLTQAEADVQAWAEKRGVAWVILRPTLIYGEGRDKNITEMARFIRRFGFFPVFGKALGLRQPIHADDVAAACLAALRSPEASCRAYNISGGETLCYRDMVKRVFAAMGRTPRLLPVPMWTFRLSVRLLRILPRYRHWSAAMAERMNRDLVFDHTDAERDFSFRPRAFRPSFKDIGKHGSPGSHRS